MKIPNQSPTPPPRKAKKGRELATGLPVRRYLYRAVVAGTLVALGFQLYFAGPQKVNRPGPSSYFRCPCPHVIAHRGASYDRPGNTIAAFREALAQGTDILELDVQLTADGHIVVVHDRNLKRKTGHDVLVSSLTLARLQQFDAGATFAARDAKGGKSDRRPFRGKGLRIPTLKAVLRTFPDARVNIEIKDKRPARTARLLFKLIQTEKALGRVLVGGVKNAAVDAWIEATGGRGTRGASMGRVLKTLFYYKLGGTFQPDFHALQIPYRTGIFTLGINLGHKDFISFAHRHGLKVHYWTVNDPADMERLFQAGADGVMSDRPHLVCKVLVGLGQRRAGCGAN